MQYKKITISIAYERLGEEDGAQGGSRTLTPRGHRNLNPACLPVPTPGLAIAIVPSPYVEASRVY